MDSTSFTAALISIERFLFRPRASAPSATEVGSMRLGNGVLRTDVPSWWMKLYPGTTMVRIWPPSGGDGVPRVTTAERLARPPVQHDLVLDTDLDRVMVFAGTTWEDA